ncbi:MAG: sigma 54-interacting transcriptional regulator [Desulfobacter sp.]|nr:MAG: sigma 54-interacting transcriptional regulator [Desulfobacter sp.]
MIRLERTKEHQDSAVKAVLNGRGFSTQDLRYREKYVALMEALFPVVDNSDIFTRIVMISNTLFGAERGALFWFEGGRFTRTPVMKSGVNLTEQEVLSPQFKSNFNLVLSAFKERNFVKKVLKPAIRSIIEETKDWSAVGVPLKIRGEIKAVLYHDRFHSKAGLDFFAGRNNSMPGLIIRHLSSFVEYGLNLQEKGTGRRPSAIRRVAPALPGHPKILYQSQVMTDLIHEADQAARSDTSVLILGETGVGKELLARRIHSSSLRRENPFVTINATTIPEGLFESELFGHEKGSFTGAERRKKGLIEVADGGTLFIDEVGEMPLHMQVKLLRAIQEKTFYRVGGTQIIHSDFRLITATNSDLMLEACEGRFREDLYYRLNLFSFTIPPLRDRSADITVIANYYLEHYSRKYSKENLSLDETAKNLLQAYSWPGNIRQLKNVIEKAVIMTASGEPLQLSIAANSAKTDLRTPFADTPTLNEINRRYILHILDKTKGKISGPGGAAELLNIGRTTLTARMKRLGIK